MVDGRFRALFHSVVRPGLHRPRNVDPAGCPEPHRDHVCADDSLKRAVNYLLLSADDYVRCWCVHRVAANRAFRAKQGMF